MQSIYIAIVMKSPLVNSSVSTSFKPRSRLKSVIKLQQSAAEYVRRTLHPKQSQKTVVPNVDGVVPVADCPNIPCDAAFHSFFTIASIRLPNLLL
jgi:alpha-ketoglutarate-dependent taurine dioxygenase